MGLFSNSSIPGKDNRRDEDTGGWSDRKTSSSNDSGKGGGKGGKGGKGK